MGKPGSPIPPPAGGSGRAQPVRRGLGKPGFPRPSPGGRGWEGVALSRGVGKPGFPPPPPRLGADRTSEPMRLLPHWDAPARGSGRPSPARGRGAGGEGQSTHPNAIKPLGAHVFCPPLNPRRGRAGEGAVTLKVWAPKPPPEADIAPALVTAAHQWRATGRRRAPRLAPHPRDTR